MATAAAMTTGRFPDSVCAIVVAYFPDEGFNARLQAVLSQVGRVVVVDNTPQESTGPGIADVLTGLAKIQLISNQSNLGISAALNQGLNHAREAGFKWALTLDQDTLCFPDMVDTLLAVSKTCVPVPAVIGGNYLDPRNKRPDVAIGEAGDFLARKTVITSGCLVDVHVALGLGGFREDYFIDQVDHEFCLRARAQGHQVVISRKPVMTHSVGESGGVRLPLLGVLPNHPPVRKYYIARNTVVTVMGYWWREPEWCLRRLARLLLGLGGMAFLEDQGLTKVLAFAGGVMDGLRGRMGPCTREAILRPRARTS
ncbi:rhamnosyltransferase [Polaromonas sp. YR568]|uniref:glycosyltransferase family 2 protein n=1 Tax=Polaromonas sp. YR568 TaxID=1855301 RepID=UPI0008E25472|nr:glycosyltransferase family 2 protein [Polaromonas sp. YR568]SFV01871.1 rhamnosyltransferase [Polaromonas sp. YR568]